MAKRKTQTAQEAEAAKETAVTAAEVEAAENTAEAEKTEKAEPAEAGKARRGRKPGTKKADIKTRIAVQYLGKEISEQEMIAKAKKAWTAKRNKVGDIKTIDLYVKPEDNAVYFVINGEFTGSAQI